MQLPQRMARFNRQVTNPVLRMVAGWAPLFGILEHVGRTSGRRYRTPLTVFETADGVAILLTYGPDSDWVKNVLAADQVQMRRHGKTLTLTDPQVLGRDEAAQSVVGPAHRMFARLPFEQAVLLRRVA